MDCACCQKSFHETELMRQGNVVACMECSMELFSPKKGCDPGETKRLTFGALKHAGLGCEKSLGEEGGEK